MSSIKVRIGESIEKALRALKKKLDREGVMKTAKSKRYHQKPSIKRREKSKAATKWRLKAISRRK
ncbi:30S ribosomal protein S21 [Chlamydiales bacterium SCGC AG-110-M15]|nr:30S ribosomal protein S21 [Chlamydiales bacterium SCGC AG-110-M15]